MNWPFTPPAHGKKLGEGPFHVRGSVYAGHVEIVPNHIPGGWSTVSGLLGNPDVEHFLRDTIFLASSSYDIEPLMHLMRVLAGLMKMPLDKFIRDGARGAAERDVVGKYRAQLRSASTDEMAARLPRIFTRYFEPCRAESVSVQPTSTEVRYEGLPASALGFYLWSSEGFILGALESAGAKDVRFSGPAQVVERDFNGIPVQSLTIRVSWTNA